MNKQRNYGVVRKNVFNLWLKKTKRSRIENYLDDDISNTLDCKWQYKAEKLGYNHISLFCSLGEWSSNITDLLSEEKFDQLRFDQDPDTEILFRLYTRYMLIISEIVEDFIELNAFLKNISGKKYKDKSGNDFETLYFDTNELKNLSTYINCICKHKYNNIHFHNHHIPKAFRDSKPYDNFYFNIENVISLKKPLSEISNQKLDNTVIEVPKLKYLIGIIIKCYSTLQTIFKNNKNYFLKTCDHFDSK